MPWFPWPEYIKKKACRYLLQHYVGSFLEEKLSLDQLSVDLYSGTGTVEDVKLDVWAINENLEAIGAPVEVRDGRVGSISVSIPWSALLTSSSKVEIRDMKLTLQPKYREEEDIAESNMESLWSSMSMTQSMKLAEDCLRNSSEGEQEAKAAQPFEGPEILAQTIESVLTRIEVSLVRTVIKLEHVPYSLTTAQSPNRVISLEMRIELLKYYDEMCQTQNPSDGSSVDPGKSPIFQPASILQKNLQMTGVTLHVEEFPEDKRNDSFAPISNTDESSSMPPTQRSTLSDVNASSPEMPPLHRRISDPLIEASTPMMCKCIIGEFAGKLEVVMKIRQNERLNEPKAEVDMKTGSFSLLLSPKQVYLLWELGQGFITPATRSQSPVKRMHREKRMTQEDYQRIEGDLQDHRIPNQYGSLHPGLHSDDDLEPLSPSDYGADDMFYSMSKSGAPSTMGLSSSHDMESSFTSTISSTSTDTTQTGISYQSNGTLPCGYSASFQGDPISRQPARSRRKKHSSHHLDDTVVEVTNYKLKCSSFSLTLLHDDPMTNFLEKATFTSDNEEDSHEPGRILSDRAKKFFGELGKVGFKTSDAAEWKERFARACPYDHLRFISTPLSLFCERKTGSSHAVLTVEFSIGTALLQECLMHKPKRGTQLTAEHIEILSFDKKSLEQASVKVSWKHTQKLRTESRQQRASRLQSAVMIELAPLVCEIDISLVDRLYTILHLPQIYGNDVSLNQNVHKSFHMQANLTKQACFNQVIDDSTNGPEHQIDICVSCCKAHVALRFPVPDLRDMSDIAWFKRSLRQEVLHVDFLQLEFKTTTGIRAPCKTYILQTKEIHGGLEMDPGEPPIPILMAVQGCGDNIDKNFDWPRLVVKQFPVREKNELEDAIYDDTSISPQDPNMDTYNSFMHVESPEATPFTSKKIIYESEQMVMPGDTEEMRKFVEETSNNSKFLLEVHLPSVSVKIPNKEVMEKLYNRFGNDLILWTPSAPSPHEVAEVINSIGLTGALDIASTFGERFAVCRSGLYGDSDSDDEESMPYYSIKRSNKKLRLPSKEVTLQNLFSLSLEVDQLRFEVVLPVKENPVPVSTEYFGHALVEAENITMFSVNEFKGDPTLSYFCLQVTKFQVFQNGKVPICTHSAVLQPAGSPVPNHLKSCLHVSDEGVISKQAIQNKTRPMLALAMKMDFNDDTNIKEIQCAIGLRGASLMFMVSPPEYNWITQIADFFDLQDEPIQGYTLPKVVTHLHTHLWGCGVDYRPINLPLRAFILMESLSISSNLVYESQESLLRFLIEDTSLFLSEKCNEKKVDLRRDYVCVLDVGMLELNLRISTAPPANDPFMVNADLFENGKSAQRGTFSKGSKKNPSLELRVKNDVIHVRTCADSCGHLAKLLLYLANDGDLREQQASEKLPINLTHQIQQSNLSRPRETDPHPKQSGTSPVAQAAHLDQMQKLMEEAMEDVSPNAKKSTNDSRFNLPCTIQQSPSSDVFIFPDEDSGASPVMESSLGAQQTTDLLSEELDNLENEEPTADKEEYPDDDDFCVLDEEMGMGIVGKDSEPEVNIRDSVTFVESHFRKPLGQTDQLQAPPFFPSAVLRYTIEEVTLIWHIYGGNDFKSTKHKPNSTPQRTTRSRSSEREGNESPKPSPRKKKNVTPQDIINMGWKERGGPGRDHKTLMELQLSKVRFRHETYPETTEQASRQILLISDVEIRDRLADSQINKFLYQYSSELRPRRSQANMMSVRALHVRPDPKLPRQECCLRVSLQPIRLNIDQDALFFLITFAEDVSSFASNMPFQMGTAPVPHLKPYCQVPAQSNQKPFNPDLLSPEELKPFSAENLIDIDSPPPSNTPPSVEDLSAKIPIFFRSVTFSPDTLIRLDYEGKRVAMEQGAFLGLLAGLGQLNRTELSLKRIHHRQGVLGIDKLIAFVINEWTQDMKRNQLPSIIGGVGPMQSIVQLGQGLIDLVRLPLEQYQRDGRIFRGLQRGAHSFSTSTAMASVELSNRFVKLLQSFAELAYDVVTPGVSQRAITYGPFGQEKLARQPTDLREGITNAYNIVREGFIETGNEFWKIAYEEHRTKGVTGAVGGIIRQIPPSFIRPIILATQATSSILGGTRNQILPDAKKEDDEKWRSNQAKGSPKV